MRISLKKTLLVTALILGLSALGASAFAGPEADCAKGACPKTAKADAAACKDGQCPYAKDAKSDCCPEKDAAAKGVCPMTGKTATGTCPVTGKSKASAKSDAKPDAAKPVKKDAVEMKSAEKKTLAKAEEKPN